MTCWHSNMAPPLTLPLANPYLVEFCPPTQASLCPKSDSYTNKPQKTILLLPVKEEEAMKLEKLKKELNYKPYHETTLVCTMFIHQQKNHKKCCALWHLSLGLTTISTEKDMDLTVLLKRTLDGATLSPLNNNHGKW